MADATAGDAYTALTRFGLGARRGEAAEIAGNPRGFVLAQLARPNTVLLAAHLPTAKTAIASIAGYYAKRRQGLVDDDGTKPAVDIYRAEVLARARHAVLTEDSFVERLVMFWSNFFSVSGEEKRLVHGTVGAFEREAIRPHVLGRFVDMLTAATRHPAMLTYLDNNRSFGPHSSLGMSGGSGLNENLARETLELHALGVDGGYSQADVAALARIITGWRSLGERDRRRYGSFYFDSSAHEPGSFAMLGRQYSGQGVRQGEAALADLARHPATARYTATRLVAHFVTTPPPPGIVGRVAQAFVDSDGDLEAVAAALATADEAWTLPPMKFLPPYDFVVAAHRATGTMPAMPDLQRATAGLGQQTWFPRSPEGWPDDDMVWAAPDALVGRADWASDLAARSAGRTDVVTLAASLLGPRLRPATRDAIANAATRAQGITLLLASSEFQLR